MDQFIEEKIPILEKYLAEIRIDPNANEETPEWNDIISPNINELDSSALSKEDLVTIFNELSRNTKFVSHLQRELLYFTTYYLFLNIVYIFFYYYFFIF